MNYSSKLLAVVLLSSVPTLFAGTITVTTEKDSTSVLHNPAMGFFIHYESQAMFDGDWSGSSDWLYNTAYSQGIKYCNILYIRTSWKSLEPSDGVYTWNTNTGFKAILATAKSHGFRVAFRATVQDGKGTPQFVVNAIRAAGRNPYPTKQTFQSGDSIINLQDPIWQAEFTQFVSAFGAAFDTPASVDFIDINGLSNWGEGNAWIEGFDGSQTVKQGSVDVPKDQPLYFDWHVAQYDAAFKNVILADQKGWNVPIDEKYGLAYRMDGFGGPDSGGPDHSKWSPWDTITNPFILIGEPWGGTATVTQEAAHYFSARCNVVSFRDEDLWKARPNVLAQAVSKIGYRLRPAKVDYSSTTGINSPSTIHHTWVNDARGYLPNNDRRWNKKYSIAFALFPQSGNTPVQFIIDSATNPGDFFENHSYPLTSTVRWNVPVGSYKLAVGILDKTRPNDSSLSLSIANPTKRGGWYLLGDIQLTAQSPTSSAFEQIEAENYSSVSGLCVQTCSEGGQDFGCIANNAYAVFKNLDFGSGAHSFSTRVGSPDGTGKISLHLDSLNGVVAGTLTNATSTSSWETFATVSTDIPQISGIHDLYLQFESGLNLNWFTFGRGTTSLREKAQATPRSLASLRGHHLVFSPGWKTPTRIRLVSLTGKQVFSTTVSGNSEIFDVGDLSEGIYLFEARNKAGRFSQRLVKD